MKGDGGSLTTEMTRECDMGQGNGVVTVSFGEDGWGVIRGCWLGWDP